MSLPNNFVRSVWVSYSGADQAFVQALEACVRENYTKVSKEGIIPFRLMVYQRNQATSEPETSDTHAQAIVRHLRPGDRITDLVQAIASSLRGCYL